MLAGPLTWAVLLEFNYAMSYVACEQRHSWILHVATVCALSLIAMGALLAWRASPSLGYHELPSIDPAETAVLRARFMAIGGLALCGFFFLVVLATEIPVLVLPPCSW